MLSITKLNCEFSFLLNEEKLNSRTTLSPLFFSAGMQLLVADLNECRDDVPEAVRFLSSLEQEGGQRSITDQREARGCMSKFSPI